MSSNNKITIICVHYNEPLPEHISLTRRTMLANKSVDWVIFTDQEFIAEENIKVVNLPLAEISHLASLNLEFKVDITNASKLADLEVAYGLIFSKWLVGCDWWAHADLNMIFGDIAHYLKIYEEHTDMLSTDRNKLSSSLSFYRNKENINKLILKVPDIQAKLQDSALHDITGTEIDILFINYGLNIRYNRANIVTQTSSKWRHGKLYDNNYLECIALILDESTLTKIRNKSLPICSFYK